MGGFELDMLVLQDLLRDTIWERGKFSEDTGREMASSTIGTAKAMRVALSVGRADRDEIINVSISLPKGGRCGIDAEGAGGNW